MGEDFKDPREPFLDGLPDEDEDEDEEDEEEDLEDYEVDLENLEDEEA